jgi:hypothetical protein
MNFLERLVSSFIMAFGITEPSPAQRKTATLFIFGLIGGIALIFLALVAVLLWHF